MLGTTDYSCWEAIQRLTHTAGVLGTPAKGLSVSFNRSEP